MSKIDYSDLQNEQKFIVIREEKDESSFQRINVLVGFALKIVGLVIILQLMIIIPLFLEQMANQGKAEIKNVQEFSFKTAEDFSHINYYGKEELFNYIINNITNIIHLTETKKVKELHGKLESSARNFLLYGPPGTGKTLFVQKLIHLLNLKLNEIYKTENKNYVRAYFITPSSLLDKFYGETERKIKKLFEEARDDKNWKATFIFLDEVDAFFGNRNMSQDGHSNRTKTEFLNLLNGITDDIKKNVFFIGATNMIDTIDEAFIRRLGESKEFEFPTQEEIQDMLSSICENWPEDKNSAIKLQIVSEIFAKRASSHALISDVCKNLIRKYGIDSKHLYSKLYYAVKNAEAKLQKKDNAPKTKETQNNLSYKDYLMNQMGLPSKPKVTARKFNIGDFDNTDKK